MRASTRDLLRIFQKLHILCASCFRKSKFNFDESCFKAFVELKEKFVSAPIIISLDWSKPFEVTCNASGVALGVVLGQRKNKILHPIYYTSKSLMRPKY